MPDMSQSSFTRGQALRYLRAEYKGLDQKQLAIEARKLWYKYRRQQVDDGVEPDLQVGVPCTIDSFRVALSRFESHDKQLTKDQKTFACLALGVDLFFIEDYFLSKDELEDSLKQWLLQRRNK